MFSNLSWSHLVLLLLLGLFIFGPDRLPEIAAEAGKTLRKLQRYAQGLTEDLKAELGPEMGDFDLRSMHPKEFVRKHLFDDSDFDEAVPLPLPPPAYRPLHPSEPAPWDPDAT